MEILKRYWNSECLSKNYSRVFNENKICFLDFLLCPRSTFNFLQAHIDTKCRIIRSTRRIRPPAAASSSTRSSAVISIPVWAPRMISSRRSSWKNISNIPIQQVWHTRVCLRRVCWTAIITTPAICATTGHRRNLSWTYRILNVSSTINRATRTVVALTSRSVIPWSSIIRDWRCPSIQITQ